MENITTRIRSAAYEFEGIYGKRPTCLYLGRNEFVSLFNHPTVSTSTRGLPAGSRAKFEELSIYRVDDQSHVAVS